MICTLVSSLYLLTSNSWSSLWSQELKWRGSSSFRDDMISFPWVLFRSRLSILWTHLSSFALYMFSLLELVSRLLLHPYSFFFILPCLTLLRHRYFETHRHFSWDQRCYFRCEEILCCREENLFLHPREEASREKHLCTVSRELFPFFIDVSLWLCLDLIHLYALCTPSSLDFKEEEKGIDSACETVIRICCEGRHDDWGRRCRIFSSTFTHWWMVLQMKKVTE